LKVAGVRQTIISIPSSLRQRSSPWAAFRDRDNTWLAFQGRKKLQITWATAHESYDSVEYKKELRETAHSQGGRP